MDDLQQQKSQIDEEARKAKEVIDANAVVARQTLADQAAETVRSEAEKRAVQIENDA
jgi:hypothetical protein